MRLTIEPLQLPRDLATLHAWVTHPRSVFWGMQGATLEEVHTEYARIADDPHHEALLGRADGSPAFLMERYDPAHSPLAHLPELRAGDLGMHLLVAPTDTPVPGFTSAVMRRVVEECFADPSVHRVVVEPDIRNDKIARLNAAVGFRVVRPVDLPDKTAAFSVCTRADFEGDDHLTPAVMSEAQRRLGAKAIAEFSHERLLTPTVSETGWRVVAGASTYDFTARVHALEHWVIDASSLIRTVLGEPAPLDAQELIVECQDVLGIPAGLLPTYLEEIASTLASSAWKLVHHRTSSADLVHADYQEIEAAMSEGHPAFVANNGRIGFSADDFAAYAPETGSDVRLLWIAVRRSEAHLSLSKDLDEQEHYAAELGADLVASFQARLKSLGLDPEGYLYLPVHPWQWTHRLAITFAPDVARRSLVLLGEGPGAHRAQQSIRTFFPIEHPTRSYVKVALAIQNMGFVRGLSPAYMAATPAINDWVASVVNADETLAGCGFSVLREHAAIGWTGDVFHRLADTSPYRKMIAALWRESPMERLAPGERLATMASLLHRDRDGVALASELVRASGLPAEEWVATYLRAYLRPLVHCLLAYDLAFMPHGENLVMVLDGHVPTRMLMKDIGEEVAVMGDLPLPPEVERIRADVPPDVRALAIHTDVFDGFLRYLAAILDEDGVLESAIFWRLVADCVIEHERLHPELADAAAAYDLMRATFRHSCLNRLQLRNTLQMVDLTDQAESLIFAGELANPIASPEVEEGRRLVSEPEPVGA